MRITSTPGFHNRSFANHPTDSAVCVRIDGPKALIMWHRGYLRVPISQVPTCWWTPKNDQGQDVPLRVRRPMLGGRYAVLDVEFLTPAQSAGNAAPGGGSVASLLLNVLAGLSR